MPLFSTIKRNSRLIFTTIFFAFSFFFYAFRPTQLNLHYRLLEGYFLSNDISIEKGKPTLFVFEQSNTFEQAFKPATTMRQKPTVPNFAKEMVIGIALPTTNKPPKLSVSRVFIQDSTLSVRYIRIRDTTARSFTTQPILLFAIPRHHIVKTRLIENGKLVRTVKKEQVD